MNYFASTDIGNYREQNEDFYYAGQNLFVVADGMGGHAAGEVASKIAVETFTNNFFKNIQPVLDAVKNIFLENNLENSPSNNVENNLIYNLLSSSIELANKEVFKLASSHPEYLGMGTTFTACYILNNKAYIIHVGDSRVYLKNKDSFKLLTQDHTVVWQMYKKGLITYDEIFSHPLRNYLENVLGIEPNINFNYITENLEIGDILLLCTDGLNSMLKDNNIHNIIIKNNKDAKKITKSLIQSAKKNGGLDNITVITIII